MELNVQVWHNKMVKWKYLMAILSEKTNPDALTLGQPDAQGPLSGR